MAGRRTPKGVFIVAFGLIGCGDIAQKRVAPVLSSSPVCKLVAVSRARSQFAESFAKKFGALRWYADWRELLQDKDIAAVYVATPVHLHAEQTIAAIEAGKHVLCEKPMALTVVDCNRMIAASNRQNVKLGVAYYRHFYPVVVRIKQIINEGEIGTVVAAQMNAFEWFDPPADHPRSWVLKKQLSGGGPMFDFGCHRIEVLLDIFGSVDEVKAMSSNKLFRREVEDVATVIIDFERGPIATLTVAHSAREPQDTLDIFGSKGSIHVPVLNEGKLRVLTEAGVREEFYPPAANLHQPLIEDFARAIMEDRSPVVDGAIGLAVAQIEEEITRQ
ncbi:MAG TPA: Gfo/Idh/MocA family oxidoreductase [Pyrinomonadaceae bacterium]|nr:Gfo/Idh/MocA family oxidoreductase [Pyrinomonadaceae bacterium]